MKEDGARATAALRAVDAGTSVRLSVSGLERPRAGTYELWCVADDGRWLSGGTFRVDRSGKADVELTSAAKPGDYHRVVLTRRAADERQVVMAAEVSY
jgi:hypothetical protein